MAAGRLDREQARELLQCFWIKHNYAYDYQGRVGPTRGSTPASASSSPWAASAPDGEDATNDLTWLMLDVIEEMNLLEPKPNVRLHQKTPDDLLRRVAGLIASAQGSPFLLNFDEASIRGLEWQGLPEDQLWDYAPVGCLENTLQGYDRSGTVDVNLNLAKAVELALNDGQRHGDRPARSGPRTGDPRALRRLPGVPRPPSRQQLKALLEHLIDCNNEADAIRAGFEPTPYLSVLVDGCAESGRDVTAGGARHNYITVEGIALATAVDSLVAVKQPGLRRAAGDHGRAAGRHPRQLRGARGAAPDPRQQGPQVRQRRPRGRRPGAGGVPVLDRGGLPARRRRPPAGATAAATSPGTTGSAYAPSDRRHARRPPAGHVPLQRRLPGQRRRPRGPDGRHPVGGPAWGSRRRPTAPPTR